jgi:hypothetical protein
MGLPPGFTFDVSFYLSLGRIRLSAGKGFQEGRSNVCIRGYRCSHDSVSYDINYSVHYSYYADSSRESHPQGIRKLHKKRLRHLVPQPLFTPKKAVVCTGFAAHADSWKALTELRKILEPEAQVARHGEPVQLDVRAAPGRLGPGRRSA